MAKSISRYRSGTLDRGPDIKDLLKHAAPVATSFGISRLGSKLISAPFINRSTSPLVVRGIPVFASAVFVGVAYGLTALRPLERYRTGALIGAVANLLLTLIAQIFPSTKPLMGLAGWDYSHVRNPKAQSAQGPRSSSKALATIEPGSAEDPESTVDDDLNQGVFADTKHSWSF